MPRGPSGAHLDTDGRIRHCLQVDARRFGFDRDSEFEPCKAIPAAARPIDVIQIHIHAVQVKILFEHIHVVADSCTRTVRTHFVEHILGNHSGRADGARYISAFGRYCRISEFGTRSDVEMFVSKRLLRPLYAPVDLCIIFIRSRWSCCAALRFGRFRSSGRGDCRGVQRRYDLAGSVFESDKENF